MKTLTKTFRINRVTRLNNSYYGNPRYELSLEDENDAYVAKTCTDGAVGYTISYTWEGREATLKYHYTRTGNIIVTGAELIKE